MKYTEKKIKVISRKKEQYGVITYEIESFDGIGSVSFQFSMIYGWGLMGNNYRWNRSFILFAEAVIRGLNSDE